MPSKHITPLFLKSAVLNIINNTGCPKNLCIRNLLIFAQLFSHEWCLCRVWIFNSKIIQGWVSSLSDPCVGRNCYEGHRHKQDNTSCTTHCLLDTLVQIYWEQDDKNMYNNSIQNITYWWLFFLFQDARSMLLLSWNKALFKYF